MAKLMIVVASTRPGRIGPAVARWFQARAAERGGFEIDLADLADLNLPFMDEPNHPRLRQYTKPHTLAWSARVDAADAFVFVMPEYNYGFNAPLKNAIDFLHQEWQRKPVGLVSYGGVSAGTRAAQMIKQVVTTLDMMPLNEAVQIPFVRRFVDEAGTFRPDQGLEDSAQVLLGALQRWAEAMRGLR